MNKVVTALSLILAALVLWLLQPRPCALDHYPPEIGGVAVWPTKEQRSARAISYDGTRILVFTAEEGPDE